MKIRSIIIAALFGALLSSPVWAWGVMPMGGNAVAGCTETALGGEGLTNGAIGFTGAAGGTDFIVTTATTLSAGSFSIGKVANNCGASATSVIRLKVWRSNGSNYDLVGTSEEFAMSSAKTGVYTLASPITVETGDLIGFWINSNGISEPYGSVDVKSGTCTTVKLNGNVLSGSVAKASFSASSTSYYAEVVFYSCD